jgi:predicted nuclease of predicted toxin-antitoxin system
MTLWLDAQISPALAVWLRMRFDLDAVAVREIGLRDAEDSAIFAAARDAGVTVMTKDSDFVDLLRHHGPPPQIIWLRCGNTSNARLKQLLSQALPAVLPMLEGGEPLVEIGDAW